MRSITSPRTTGDAPGASAREGAKRAATSADAWTAIVSPIAAAHRPASIGAPIP
ncbi:MAG: hypothetical protein U0414_44140 [Polyangiaceae bacterium]